MLKYAKFQVFQGTSVSYALKYKYETVHPVDCWVMDVNRSMVPGAPLQTCFVSSFSWCRKKQVLNLEEKGSWPELLDGGKTEICVSD